MLVIYNYAVKQFTLLFLINNLHNDNKTDTFIYLLNQLISGNALKRCQISVSILIQAKTNQNQTQ